MNKEQIITTLKNHQANFKQFGVVRLALFGSVARNEATENSDIDLFLSFPSATWERGKREKLGDI